MDAESFKKEFLPYHRKLYCIAYRLLENAADAEDLVQEAYLKLWDKREGLAIISNPEAAGKAHHCPSAGATAENSNVA